MRIAEFDHRLVLETPQIVEDENGGHTKSWRPLLTLWAKVIPLSGSEFVLAASLRSELSHEVVLRYRGELKPTMRLTAPNRTLEIIAVLGQSLPKHWPVCHCREVPLQ
ncbi:MAG TPA: phage head closure protein [Aestuariivirgaceae bacterium]|jgi:SPP1 family predicted phage head-tail adaptor